MIFSVLHTVSDPLFKKMSSSKEKKKKLYTNFPEVSVATSKLTNKSERHNGQFLKSGQIELEWHVRSQFNQKLLQVWLLVKLESKNNSYTIEPTLRTPTWLQTLHYYAMSIIPGLWTPEIGFCTLCFCFPTKMLHLNAPFFQLKCSVSPKKSVKCSDNAHYTNGFFKINFKVYTYKNVQVLLVTTTTCTSS